MKMGTGTKKQGIEVGAGAQIIVPDKGLTEEAREKLIIAASIARELERRKKEELLRYYVPHAKQQILHKSKKRVKVATGGNRTGKSRFSSVETVLGCLGRDAEPYIQEWPDENKKWWYERFNYDAHNFRAWCATQSWDVQRDVMQENILMYIPKRILRECEIGYRKKGVMDFIIFPNGARLTFKSYETGWQGFQGASVDLIALDEEPPYDIWNECEKRVMDRKGTLIITYTPLQGLTWSYDRLYLNVNNDREIIHVEMTWDDNPYLDPAEKQRLLENMSQEEKEARIYGRYVIGGSKVFDTANLTRRRDELSNAPVHYFEYSPELNKYVPTNETVGNVLEVYEMPVKGNKYVIGIDVAQGLPEKDNSIACVLEEKSGRQVAELVGDSTNTTYFAEQVDCLGRWYNYAFLVPERNNDGKALITSLIQKHMYIMIYLHQDDREYGWPETAVTRPLLIQKGQDMIKTAPETIFSKNLIDECLTFVRNSHGKPQAVGKGTKGGKRDDRVFAWMLAVAGREARLMSEGMIDPLKPVTPITPKDKKKDFFNDDDRDVNKKSYASFDPQHFVSISSGGEDN